MSNRGMIPHGEGFLVTPTEAASLDGGALAGPYRNGKDLTAKARGLLVLDTFGLSEPELRQRYPESWQRLFDRVRPETRPITRGSLAARTGGYSAKIGHA